MAKDTAAEIMSAVQSFPPISGNAARVIQLLSQAECDLDEVERVVRCDPGLTADILKVANSAYFGLGGTIGSVREAMVRLGVKRIFQLVVMSSVRAAMQQPVVGYDLPPSHLLRHALAVSVVAEDLAGRVQIPKADEVFTAGLLHDIGKLAMGSFVQADLPRIEGLASSGRAFDFAEREVLGVDHAEVGAMILENWAFPADLVTAVRWHHRPEECRPRHMLVDVVHVADLLCMMIGFNEGRDSLTYRTSLAVVERLQLNRDHLEATASRTMPEVLELATALAVPA
jgi:putative nucleotidyltransferase with HDIG domain